MQSSLMGCKPSKFEHQVAGHTTKMVRRYGEECVIKPQIKVDLFAREVQFYEEVFRESAEVAPPAFFPRFYGLVEVEEEQTDETAESAVISRPYIILQDMTLSYSQPSMIDIKMGRQTFEPTASTAKVERELRKYPYQKDIGFRITGMKSWNCSDKQYFTVDKWFGRSLEPVQVPFGLAAFFFTGDSFRVRAMQDAITQLRGILQWMEQQKRYKFFCSSILIVYDSDNNGESTPVGEEELTCRVSMIDFAHVCINSPDVEEVDEGYIFGILSLISHIQSVIDISARELDCKNFMDDMKQFLSSWQPRK